MTYFYLKAVHIIFVVTWFAGLFYMPRLLIYNVEANSKSQPIKEILQAQFSIMMKRLWYGITWPSAILTLVLGFSVLIYGNWETILSKKEGLWLLLKLIVVLFLYGYHFATHLIFKQQINGIFKFNSQQLRLWNEIATVFLITIVMLVVVKQEISLVWGLVGVFVFVIFLVLAIRIYKKLRNKKIG